jgi:hypothetical protein
MGLNTSLKTIDLQTPQEYDAAIQARSACQSKQSDLFPLSRLGTFTGHPPVW